MNESEIIKQRLFARTGKGIKYDLARMVEASRVAGDPHNAFNSIHVAGTNGKGSTCTYLESMIRHHGKKTGLYTSPHILHFEERFAINGNPIEEAMWLAVYRDLEEIITLFDLTFFEATTLMAFELFKREKVEWAIIETGLGGRLDATNIITPSVSVITMIDMDHKDLLGDTLPAIANEKFGIIKENVPVVIAKNDDSEVMIAAVDICKTKQAPLSIIAPEQFSSIDNVNGQTVTALSGGSWEIMMKGAFQIVNSALAVEAFKQAGFNFDNRALEGLQNAYIAGRFQHIRFQDKTVIFDVGHNPHAARALTTELSTHYNGKSICIVTGIMKDKDYSGMIKLYLTVADKILLTRPSIDRAASVDDLRKGFESEKRLQVREIVADACREALSGDESVVCVTGSFYTVCEAFKYFSDNLQTVKQQI